MINIIHEVRLALDTLEKNGYCAYVVGGCVRDSLLLYTPKDWDITTSALPEEILSCFCEYRVIETGIKYGTVTVIINKIPIEVTTYRIDGEYKDNRRPKGVIFTDKIYDDLSRRDFTVNAIAYNHEIIDFFGGVCDIENKIIKTVGEPDKRFCEDALRILRGLRFSSQLGFEIEENTKKSILNNKKLLKNIAAERISKEFFGIITGINFFSVLNEYKDVIFEIFYEIKNINEALKDSENKFCLRMSLLLYQLSDAKKPLERLRLDNSAIKRINSIIVNKNIEIPPEKIQIKKLLSKYGTTVISDIIKIRKDKKLDKILAEIIENNECFEIKNLKINGNDIKKLGISGEKTGQILNNINMLVCEEKLPNNREILLSFLENQI